MDELRNYLNTLEPGPVEETTHLERLLAEVWDDLGGDNGGMAGHKLIGRMEHVEWHPPVLTFVIERHGGTVLGSTRAELQRWSVDLDRQTATCECTGHRQLSPMARRVDVGSIADEVARKITSGEADDRLTLARRWACPGGGGQDLPRKVGIQADRPGTETTIERSLDRETHHKGLGSSR